MSKIYVVCGWSYQKRFAASSAHKGFVVAMGEDVLGQTGFMGKRLFAHIAFEGLLSGMRS